MKPFLTIALTASVLGLAFGGSAEAQMAPASGKPPMTKPMAKPMVKATPRPMVTTPGGGTVAPAPKPTPTPAAKHTAKPAGPKAPLAPPQPNGPGGATAKCKDGSMSKTKTRSGACAGHKGVAQWY